MNPTQLNRTPTLDVSFSPQAQSKEACTPNTTLRASFHQLHQNTTQSGKAFCSAMQTSESGYAVLQEHMRLLQTDRDSLHQELAVSRQDKSSLEQVRSSAAPSLSCPHQAGWVAQDLL